MHDHPDQRVSSNHPISSGKPTIQERVDAVPYDALTHIPKARVTSSNILDRIFPPTRKYIGLNRRKFLIALFIALLAALALIIGLALGLTRSKSTQSLPLTSDRQSFTGDLTYYGPGLGACGITSTDSDNIVSISHYLFDAEQKGSDPNQNPLCGLMIRAERTDARDGRLKSIDLQVVDRCKFLIEMICSR